MIPELDEAHAQRSLAEAVAARNTTWTVDMAFGAYAFVRAAGFDYATPEKIVAILDAFLGDVFDEVMEALGYLIDQPGDRKPLPQIGEIRMRIIEQRQAERARDAAQHRRELPAKRVAGAPWFSRLQGARMRAGLAPGSPLEEPDDLVGSDCERFGIHRDTLPIGGNR